MVQITDVPVFSPTMDEFKNFSKYVASIQHLCTGGLCKVIPPPEWKEGFTYDHLDEITIPHPIKQYVSGDKGKYQVTLIERPKSTVEKFREMADKEKIPKSSKYDYDDIDRIFWKNVRFNPPTYGADMSG